MEGGGQRWTDWPHLRVKLVAGFFAGCLFVALGAFFVARYNQRADRSTASTVIGTIVGYTVAFPFVVLFVIRPAIQRQMSSGDPSDNGS